MPIFVHHVAEFGPMALLSLRDVTELPPADHTLEVRLRRDDFDSDEAPNDLPLWSAIAELPGMEVVNDDTYCCAAAVVARLSIRQYPDHLREALGLTWEEWLEEMEEDVAGALADAITESHPDSLWGGTLYHFRDLQVHPEFRGQHLGARLLAHALWMLLSGPRDLAVMYAMPMPDRFQRDGTEPPRDPDAVKRLTRYYRRLGLHVWPRRGRVTGKEATALWMRGRDSLPFEPGDVSWSGDAFGWEFMDDVDNG
jgi:GNAT superfamily N-acetyltransferase